MGKQKKCSRASTEPQRTAHCSPPNRSGIVNNFCDFVKCDLCEMLPGDLPIRGSPPSLRDSPRTPHSSRLDNVVLQNIIALPALSNSVVPISYAESKFVFTYFSNCLLGQNTGTPGDTDAIHTRG